MFKFSKSEVLVKFLRTKAIVQLKREGTLHIDSHKTMNFEWRSNSFCDYGGYWNLRSKLTMSLLRTPNEPRNIVNTLNDDCLRHILEFVIDDVIGLCELAKVCTQFHPIAVSKYLNRNFGMILHSLQSTTPILAHGD